MDKMLEGMLEHRVEWLSDAEEEFKRMIENGETKGIRKLKKRIEKLKEEIVDVVMTMHNC